MWPAPSPFSRARRPSAARSPSPEQSMKVRPRTAQRPGLRLDEQRVDAPRVVHARRRPRSAWNSTSTPAPSSSASAAHLERRGVVGLRQDLAEDEMRLVEAVERAHALEQVVGDAVDDLADLAVHIGVQAAEVGDAGGGAHAAEEAVALDEQRLRAARAAAVAGRDTRRARRRGRRRRIRRRPVSSAPARRSAATSRHRQSRVMLFFWMIGRHRSMSAASTGARLGRRVGDDVHVLQLELVAHLRARRGSAPARRGACARSLPVSSPARRSPSRRRPGCPSGRSRRASAARAATPSVCRSRRRAL